LENDTTQQTQRTFARDNLLRTYYGETGVMDSDLKPTHRRSSAALHRSTAAWASDRKSRGKYLFFSFS